MMTCPTRHLGRNLGPILDRAAVVGAGQPELGQDYEFGGPEAHRRIVDQSDRAIEIFFDRLVLIDAFANVADAGLNRGDAVWLDH